MLFHSLSVATDIKEDITGTRKRLYPPSETKSVLMFYVYFLLQ